MSMVFLTAMNESLKRAGVIAGDSQGLVTSTVSTSTTATGAGLTDASKQRQIDVMIQLWDEATKEVFSRKVFAKVLATATISIVAAQREYDLPSDFERMAGETVDSRVMRGATDGLILYEYPGGYLKMLADQPTASDYQGDSSFWALSPADDKVRLSSEPATGQSGKTYNYAYDKRIEFTGTMATEVMPFSDSVTRSLVPVVSEYFNRSFRDEFDGQLFLSSVVRAVGFLTRTKPRSGYGRRRQ